MSFGSEECFVRLFEPDVGPWSISWPLDTASDERQDYSIGLPSSDISESVLSMSIKYFSECFN